MKLLTKAIENRIAKYPIYSQDGVKDKKIICKFFFGAYTWYVTEGQKMGDDDYEFFGIIDNGCEKELGYFTLGQLQSLTWHGWHCVERDRYFKPCRQSELN